MADPAELLNVSKIRSYRFGFELFRREDLTIILARPSHGCREARRVHGAPFLAAAIALSEG
ncbi:hypothetical protein [uncultured Methylovirgula sp.]|uniref:hypothetical protein n=1 Tax=uncultured Methylovirgula sp. TaxID=1285960 RepID=UPI0026384A6C|nr:hypothetical protein [uncultured Methylovirgula sp.]